MKKKVVAALLAMCMVAGALTGCGNGNQSQSSDNSSVANASAQEDSATVDEQENADAAEDTTATTEDEAASGEPVTIRFAWWGGQERADKTNAAVERSWSRIRISRWKQAFSRLSLIMRTLRLRQQQEICRMYFRDL